MENNIENNELTPAKKTGSKGPILTEVEAGVLARRGELNFPALQAFFGLTETELQTILDKLPPAEGCTTC
jgi:hypothetical protein